MLSSTLPRLARVFVPTTMHSLAVRLDVVNRERRPQCPQAPIQIPAMQPANHDDSMQQQTWKLNRGEATARA